MTQHEQFLISARDAAKASGHIWPEFAACEAALESGWGSSSLAAKYNNLFGRKQSSSRPVFETVNLPTKEWIEGEGFIPTEAAWVVYPTWADCFHDRMDTLHRLENTYQHYRNALAATDGETFVREVSQTWSTDPHRADKVLDIYHNNAAIFAS